MKIHSYSWEKERSLEIEKKIIIVYTIITTMILVIVEKQIPVIILLCFL